MFMVFYSNSHAYRRKGYSRKKNWISISASLHISQFQAAWKHKCGFHVHKLPPQQQVSSTINKLAKHPPERGSGSWRKIHYYYRFMQNTNTIYENCVNICTI